MNAKVPVFVICVEASIYLLLYNLHDCTFKEINFPWQYISVYFVYTSMLISFNYLTKSS